MLQKAHKKDLEEIRGYVSPMKRKNCSLEDAHLGESDVNIVDKESRMGVMALSVNVGTQKTTD